MDQREKVVILFFAEGKWMVSLIYRGHWCPYYRQLFRDFQRA
jgi:hypothetical protein